MRYLPVLLWIALLVYCLIDVAQADESRVRTMPKAVWFLAVIVAPILGSVAWFVWGRPLGSASPGSSRSSGRSSGARRAGPTAPDDDPDFLASLARSNAQRERERRRREQHDEPDEPKDGE